jgi:hypothetical protein
VRFGKDEAARLAAEWLTWAAQTGHAPARIKAIVPESAGGQSGPAVFGQALARCWPGAACDLAIDHDPLGTTLRRLAERVDDAPVPGEQTITSLAARPGSLHRKFYVWSSLAVAALAGAVGVAAYQLRSAAGEDQREAIKQSERWSKRLIEEHPDVATKPTDKVFELSLKLQKMEKDLKPIQPPQSAMPIVEELSTLSMVLGNSEIDLDEISLTSASSAAVATVKVRVDGVEQVELLKQAFNAIDGSYLTNWRDRMPAGRTGKVVATLTADWSEAATRKAGIKPAPAGGRR